MTLNDSVLLLPIGSSHLNFRKKRIDRRNQNRNKCFLYIVLLFFVGIVLSLTWLYFLHQSLPTINFLPDLVKDIAVPRDATENALKDDHDFLKGIDNIDEKENKNVKRILVIHEYIPKPNNHGADNRLLQIMKTLGSLNESKGRFAVNGDKKEDGENGGDDFAPFDKENNDIIYEVYFHPFISSMNKACIEHWENDLFDDQNLKYIEDMGIHIILLSPYHNMKSSSFSSSLSPSSMIEDAKIHNKMDSSVIKSRITQVLLSELPSSPDVVLTTMWFWTWPLRQHVASTVIEVITNINRNRKEESKPMTERMGQIKIITLSDDINSIREIQLLKAKEAETSLSFQGQGIIELREEKKEKIKLLPTTIVEKLDFNSKNLQILKMTPEEKNRLLSPTEERISQIKLIEDYVYLYSDEIWVLDKESASYLQHRYSNNSTTSSSLGPLKESYIIPISFEEEFESEKTSLSTKTEFKNKNFIDPVATIKDSSKILQDKTIPEQKAVKDKIQDTTNQIKRRRKNSANTELSSNQIEYGSNNVCFVGSGQNVTNARGIVWFLIEVWRFIRAIAPNTKLILIGNIPTNGWGGMTTSILKTVYNVYVAGYQSSLDQFFEDKSGEGRICSILINPSIEEVGFNTKNLLSLQYEIPLVTTLFGVKGLLGMESMVTSYREEQKKQEEIPPKIEIHEKKRNSNCYTNSINANKKSNHGIHVHDDPHGMANSILALLMNYENTWFESVDELRILKKKFSLNEVRSQIKGRLNALLFQVKPADKAHPIRAEGIQLVENVNNLNYCIKSDS